MDKEKPRLSRLIAILTQLQSKRMITAREIAEKHKVSIRTVYRDIRTLEQAGVPIGTEEGKGYFLMEGYRIPPVMFTETEADLEVAKKIQQQGEAMIVEGLKAREQLANEFLIKAQLWKIFYDKPDWFEKTCEFYEKALDAGICHHRRQYQHRHPLVCFCGACGAKDTFAGASEQS